MSPPTKKRSITARKAGPRNSVTRLGNDEFFDAFSALPRDELEKLEITVRRFRVFISEKMTKVCLRLILKASFLRCDTFRSGAGQGSASSNSWPVSSGPGFVVELTSLMEEGVSLPGVAESELTKRLPQYFRHAAIENLSFKCDPALPNATVGAGLLSSLAAVFETAHVVHYALFERLYFGASSSFRTLMECFEGFRPEELRISACQATRLTDDDLLYLRDRGTQSVSISSPGMTEAQFTDDALSPDGIIKFCFHGDKRRSFLAKGYYTMTHRLKSTFIEELVQESRACPHANHMQIRLNTSMADSELDTSMFDFDNKGEREGELYLPKDEIRVELPVDDRRPVLRFHYEGWF